MVNSFRSNELFIYLIKKLFNVCRFMPPSSLLWTVLQSYNGQQNYSETLEDSETPEMKQWTNPMIEIASYESMLNRVNGIKEDGSTPWAEFWT